MFHLHPLFLAVGALVVFVVALVSGYKAIEDYVRSNAITVNFDSPFTEREDDGD